MNILNVQEKIVRKVEEHLNQKQYKAEIRKQSFSHLDSKGLGARKFLAKILVEALSLCRRP